MGQKPKVVALIPARGGSKSIPLKNIKLINGRPLIYWTLDAASKSNYIDEVYVSTDSPEISKVVESYDNDKVKVFKRSPETATDTASTESAMLEFASKVEFQKIVLIQATSPLLKAEDLSNALEHFYNSEADSLISVVRQKRFIWQTDDGVGIKPINYNPQRRPRRQEFEGYLIENGAFYITKRKNLLDTGCRISGITTFYEMDEETYFEIDEPSDWVIVEELLKKRNAVRSNNISKIAPKIKLFAMDCDGVLTDAGMYYSVNGEEIKKFNTRDGMGIGILHARGIKTAIITGENSQIVKKRADKLGINEVFLGVKEKKEIINYLMKKYHLRPEEIAYVGDDINDLTVMDIVGLPCTVADALGEVKERAILVSKLKGGQGAVRELIDIILNVL